MSFTVYKPESTYKPGGRNSRVLVNTVSLGVSNIYFGKFNPGYERLSIAWDDEIKAIKFIPAGANDYASFKVTNSHGNFVMGAIAFLKATNPPRGRYKKIDDLTYKLI